MSSPYQEHPGTYMVQNRDSQEEITRLQLQDQMLTASMGGVLPEQPDPTRFKRILDIGCGTGAWLIEAAKTYPAMTQLLGIDISGKMLDYARVQAEANQVHDRVEFRVMDALQMLEFPPDFFDLVNMRLAASWIRTWEWPKLLHEARRVCQPEGVIRLTEADIGASSSSPAFTRLYPLSLQAFHQAGHYFTPHGDGMIAHLVGLMDEHGVQHVQTRPCTIEYRAGTPEGQFFIEDMKLATRTVLPFLRKWTQVPHDYEVTRQQMLAEMQAPDFVATWQVLTAWGNE